MNYHALNLALSIHLRYQLPDTASEFNDVSNFPNLICLDTHFSITRYAMLSTLQIAVVYLLWKFWGLCLLCLTTTVVFVSVGRWISASQIPFPVRTSQENANFMRIISRTLVTDTGHISRLALWIMKSTLAFTWLIIMIIYITFKVG